MKFVEDIPLFERIIALRSSGLFEGATIEETQSFVDRTGTRTLQAGERFVARHGSDWLFVLRGALEISVNGVPLSRTESGAFASMPRLLTQPDVEYAVFAPEPTLCVTVPPAFMIETAIENPRSLGLAMRLLVSELLMHRLSLPAGGLSNTEWEPQGDPPDEIGLVKRVTRLRSVLPGAQDQIEATAQISERAAFARLPAGTVLHREGDVADRFWGINWGVVRVSWGDEVVRLGPTDSTGFLASMGPRVHWCEAIAETEVVALRYSVDAVLDVLEEHNDLARGWILATMELVARIAETEAKQRFEQGLPPRQYTR